MIVMGLLRSKTVNGKVADEIEFLLLTAFSCRL